MPVRANICIHAPQMSNANAAASPPKFTRYQAFVVALLAFLQFSVVVDFMILSPLGAILLDELHISTVQFGMVVSAYAFSAGLSGLLTAGFADRFDRKKLLLFFYVGFVLGTVFCGLAQDYATLLAARIVTGLFGGVIGSISFAIVADLFPMSQRGRVMGVVQSSFAASQVLGIPIGLVLANHWNWHTQFFAIAALSAAVGFAAFAKLRPIDAHLAHRHAQHPLRHLWRTASKPRHLVGYAATILLATGGFMLMPFGSAYTVNNLGIALEHLPTIYIATGLCSIVAGPYLGQLCDRIGKLPVFVAGSLSCMAMVLWYTRLGVSPLWVVVGVNILLFVTVNARMVSASALTSGVPEPRDRGAYMSVNSSIQQISGGVAAWLAGIIVIQAPSGPLLHYPLLGGVVALAMAITLPLMWNVDRMVKDSPAGVPATQGR